MPAIPKPGIIAISRNSKNNPKSIIPTIDNAQANELSDFWVEDAELEELLYEDKELFVVLSEVVVFFSGSKLDCAIATGE